MVIYLRHPRHGTKVAISEAEAFADEENGWERFQHDERKEEMPQVSNTLRLKRPYNRKQA